jgi:hypothetical protein
MNLDFLLYIVALVTFWDFLIHVIDWRDRKYKLSKQYDRTWSSRLYQSKNIFSYFYPSFWGKKKKITDEKAWKRYDVFWTTTWGAITVLVIIYLIFK